MIDPQQPAFISQECPIGSAEAEKLFQLGGDYHRGRKGLPVDRAKAEKLYNEALAMGNAKAALNLAHLYLYRHTYGTRERFDDEKIAIQFMEKAVEMGCPEGTYSLAAMYSQGWGVPNDQKKAKKLVKLAAEQGALNAMVEYGLILFDQGKEQEGTAWLEKSLAAGNGDAATNLALLYAQGEGNKIIPALREGCKLGSYTAFIHLISIYKVGWYGQLPDDEYAWRITDLSRTINDQESPALISNFDELIPPKPILPFKKAQ